MSPLSLPTASELHLEAKALNLSPRVKRVARLRGISRRKALSWNGKVPSRLRPPKEGVLVHGWPLGVWLDRLKPKGVSIAWLSAQVGVSIAQVSAWKSGRFRPTPNAYAALYHALTPFVKEYNQAPGQPRTPATSPVFALGGQSLSLSGWVSRFRRQGLSAARLAKALGCTRQQAACYCRGLTPLTPARYAVVEAVLLQYAQGPAQAA